MTLANTSLSAANLAWRAVQTLNSLLPEGKLPTPAWSKYPLLKRRERAMPPLGPRKTQSVCPKCLLETRDAVLRGKQGVESLTLTPGVIDAEILEEAGTVVMRKSCERHGPFEDTLASDARFFWQMEDLFPGCDFPRSEIGPHGVHSVQYGRGSFVIVDLTTRCNMKCGTCFMDANQLGHVSEASFDEIKALLDNAASVEPKREFNILFSGGEPTLSPHFIEAVKYASSLGLIRLHVATNGIRFAEDPSFAIAAHAAGLHGVYLQIDGMTEEKNAHRGISNFLDVKLQAIENINAAGMRVTLQTTVINAVNNDGVGKIVQFAAENPDKIFGVVFQPIMFTGRDEQIDDESRYLHRYTPSQLASDLKQQSTPNWEPLRDWFPMGCYSTFSTFMDMIEPKKERGSTFVNGHPDSQIFSPLLVNRDTGEWQPIASCFNVRRFLEDTESIIDKARGPLLSKMQMALSIVRNFDPAKAPKGLAITGLFALLSQCFLRTHSQIKGWSSAVYGKESWRLLFVGSSSFQDLWSYELHNIQMSTAVVADLGLDPSKLDVSEVPFSFKNAGGWRQVSESARNAPTLSQWHKSHGRHTIFTNGQVVPFDGFELPAFEPLVPTKAAAETDHALV
jgi:7,8-dihydro-6-hydroxymethylpterin dimethyltransferase